MKEKIMVKLEFTNKQNKLKKVKFYMDKVTYEILNHQKVSEEYRKQYLIDEYHLYESERNYRRKCIKENFEIIMDKQALDRNENIGRLDRMYKNDGLKKAYNKLTDRQKKLIRMKFVEKKTQEEIARILGTSKQSISNAMKRIYEKIKKIMKKK